MGVCVVYLLARLCRAVCRGGAGGGWDGAAPPPSARPDGLERGREGEEG